MMVAAAFPLRVSLLLAAVLAAPGGLRAEVAGSLDAAYSGKYRGTGAFDALRGAVVALRAQSLTRIRASLGIFYNDDPATSPIVVQFLDAEQARARGFPGTSRGGVGEEERNGRPARVVCLITDRFISDCTDLPAVLTHEMVHAVMLGYLGESYRELPPWIQEGLAVYASGQGPEKVTRAILERGGRVDGILDGLARHREWIGDYAEDYLAFDFLRVRFGEAAVKRFVESLMRAKTPAEALSVSARLAPADFERAAREFSEEAVRSAGERVTASAGAASPSLKMQCSSWTAGFVGGGTASVPRATQVEMRGALFKVTDEHGVVTIVDSYEKIP